MNDGRVDPMEGGAGAGSDLALGDMVGGRYRIRREIARGGMAVLFEADHVPLGRRVALKLLAADLRHVPTASERLLREGRALELARHPNVVEVYDAGDDARGAYLALEMLEGRGLDALLTTRQRLPVKEAVSVTLELCAALDAAHHAGVVHRDLKPSNVFVARDRDGVERAKLLDFGVAQLASSPETPKLTKLGERLGTYEYMAPEQLLAEVTDARTDVFAAAVTLYECLTGDVPFPGGPTKLLTTVLGGNRPPPLAGSTLGLPAALDALFVRALSRDPAQRPASAGDFGRALTAATGHAHQPLALLDAPTRTAPTGVEARQYPRAPYVAPLRVVDPRGVASDGHTGDISENGALVVLEAPIVAGERVSVRFCLPVSGRVVATEGLVRWCREARHRHAVGLELDKLSAEARDEIRRYVAITAAPK